MQANRKALEDHLNLLRANRTGAGALYYDAIRNILVLRLENLREQLVNCPSEVFANLQGQAQAIQDLLKKLERKDQ